MDLLKEEKRLIERKNAALENFTRKERYMRSAITSFQKAQKELKLVRHELKSLRKQIRIEGIERPIELPTPEDSEPISESTEETED